MLELTPKGPPTSSEPFHLSTSSARLFQSCPRRFAYRYSLGIEGKAPPDERQQFGTAVHKAIEVNATKRPADWSVREATLGLDADQAALVAGTAAAYATVWEGTLSYTAAELELLVGLRNPRLVLLAIVDGLATTVANRPVLVEHKTTESDIRPGSWYWEKLQLDLQASLYLWAAARNGVEVEHVEWDVIKRPRASRRSEPVPAEYYARAGKYGKAGDLKPGTGLPAESPAEFAGRIRDAMLAEPTVYFQRAPVVRMSDELDSAVADLESIGEQILGCWDRNSFPRNPNSCMAFGKRCEFWEACTGSASPADPQLYQLRKSREPKPEAPPDAF